jgi:carboxymethylenebutenolidase
MAGKRITIASADDHSFGAYFAVPESGSGGPGLLLLHETPGIAPRPRALADLFAEEGYVVIAPDLHWRLKPGAEPDNTQNDRQSVSGHEQRLDIACALDDIGGALKALQATPACNGKIGAAGFGLGGRLAFLAAATLPIDAAAAYYPTGIEQDLDAAKSLRCPIALHFGADDESIPPPARAAVRAALAGHDAAEIYVYADADHGFNVSGHETYNRSAASLAHSRTIGLLRRAIGPRYNLDALWEEHTALEFTIRDADATMRTMVAEPYVNHVPTMTGGFGYAELRSFYANHFIPRLPLDTKIVPISRTVGADRLVDEILFCFTHDREIDFLLPGVKPTGKYVEIPTVAIVQFRGGKLYNEHIYWDQATALVQIGLLDPKDLPVAGVETARKIRDEALPANTLIARSKKCGGDS